MIVSQYIFFGVYYF